MSAVDAVRDPEGRIVGGLWGRACYGMLFVELPALGPARGAGPGRRVMALAEEVWRGVSGIGLDTWTYRAPAFDERLGFAECARITDYPHGHDRIFHVKRFQAGPASPSRSPAAGMRSQNFRTRGADVATAGSPNT